jgi:hypothetical protein
MSLLRGRARKQWDYYKEKTGNRISLPERHETINYYATTTVNPAQTITVFTCPIENKAKLLRYFIKGTASAGGALQLTILIGQNIYYQFSISASQTDQETQQFTYEDAVNISGGQVVSIQCDSTSGSAATVLYSFDIVEEENASGYLR